MYPVVIFCGGQGTRIREFEPFLPKPLIKVGNKSIIEHIFDIYLKSGFNKFILCVGYKHQEFEKYLRYKKFTKIKKKIFFHKKKKIFVTLTPTGVKTETGYRLKKIEHKILTKYFFLTYGDGVANINIKKQLQFHIRNRKAITVTGVNPPSRFGKLKVNKNTVVEFNEKPLKTKDLINGGFFVCNKSIFKYLNKNNKNLNFEKDILNKIAKKKNMSCFYHKGFWMAIDTRRDHDKLQAIFRTKKFNFQ
jgi:glucose-1-phosphate cytidylyltransferase